MLVRAGFLRQAYSGIFHLLPLGLRVQDKIEHLIDKHMLKLGASKIALSSLTSVDLWKRTDRHKNTELFHVSNSDPQNPSTGLLLAPTHEEEITKIVGDAVQSYKDLPVRLYQTTRKYRNERRPRQGLLRAKEFVMKDLYTFDFDSESSIDTYRMVRSAYNDIFSELKIPHVTADADSGNMGGKTSHEYHFISPSGEDTVMQCDKCAYTANEEVARRRQPLPTNAKCEIKKWTGISKDGKTLVEAFFPAFSKNGTANEINPHTLQLVTPKIEFGVVDPVRSWTENLNLSRGKTGPEKKGSDKASTFQLFRVYDQTMVDPDIKSLRDVVGDQLQGLNLIQPESGIAVKKIISRSGDCGLESLDLVTIKAGDFCPKCTDGILQTKTAVELGHTFHLGTRYTQHLNVTAKGPQQEKNFLQMGCHGIGVSRMIGAIASVLADEKGLNWPRVVAPFEVVLIAAGKSKNAQEDTLEIFDHIRHQTTQSNDSRIDIVLDDREGTLGSKLYDADLIGYPVIVVVGNAWNAEKKCEVQCRRLGIKEKIEFEQLPGFVRDLLNQL